MNSQRAFLWLGSLAYVVAWFIPVIKDGTTLSQGGLPGWEAFRVSLAAPWNEPASLRGAVLPFLSALTNFLVPLVLLHLHPRRYRPGPRYLPLALLLAVLVNSSWFVLGSERVDLRPGYYLWLLSFVIFAVAAFRTRRSGPATRAAGIERR